MTKIKEEIQAFVKRQIIGNGTEMPEKLLMTPEMMGKYIQGFVEEHCKPKEQVNFEEQHPLMKLWNKIGQPLREALLPAIIAANEYSEKKVNIDMLEWFYERLIYKYKENPNVDYMIHFRAELDKLKSCYKIANPNMKFINEVWKSLGEQ